MEEYKNFDAFKIDAVAAAAEAYNLEFIDCKKKAANTFSSLDLHRITSMGKPEEDEEDDDGEEHVQVTDRDNAGEEVVEIPVPEVLEAAGASAGFSSTMTLQEVATKAKLMEESSTTLRE